MSTEEPSRSADDLQLSAILEPVLTEAATRPVTLGEVLDRTADRSFGLLLVLLGLPMLVPILPPGSSTVVGPMYAILAIQMLRGQHRPWIPHRVRVRILQPNTARMLRDRALPWIRRAEYLSRTRGWRLDDTVTLRIVGCMVFLMGVVLLSPLPFLNTLPALAVMLMGIGTLNRDLIFILVGLVVGGVSLALIGLSAGVIVALLQRLWP